MLTVTSEQVAEYDGLVLSIARRYVGFGTAELDDLIQEGRISVWWALSHGRLPSKDIVEKRMIGWLRFLRRLIHNDAAAYDKLLPLEEDRTYGDPLETELL